MSYAMQYEGTPVVPVQTGYDTFRVFDKPAEGRMMVTSSMSAAMSGGAVSGLTLGAAPASAPKPYFQEAARKHLDSTGRQTCTITDGYLIIEPQWEFRYSCPAA